MVHNTFSNGVPWKAEKKASSGSACGIVLVLDGNGKVVAANSGEAPKEVYEDWIQEALGS